MSPPFRVALVALAALAALSGCSTGSAAEQQSFDISGTITLGLGNATRSDAPANAGCQGSVLSGLTDMVGTQIVALDSSGDVLQTGKIKKGIVKWEPLSEPAFNGATEQAYCELPFTIDKVTPAKKDLYKLQVKGLTDSEYLPAAELSGVDLRPTAK